MSISSAMQAGVSGLMSNSSALAAISDNIANINTTAYKRTQVNFSDIVTAQALKNRYSAGGVQGTVRQYVSQQGLIQAANSSTDLAISGDGFFVVANKGAGLASSDPRSFTRAGSFSVDSAGYLVNDAKLYLQGWPVQTDGSFITNASDLTMMDSINVKNISGVVSKTTDVTVNANLDKRGVTGSVGDATYVGTTAFSMADYADDPTTGTKPDFTLDLPVVDSEGETHKFQMAFLKDSSAPNSWHAEIYAVPKADVTGLGRPGQLARGKVTFNTDGSFNQTTTTLFGAANAIPKLTLAASGGAAPAWAATEGVAASTVNLDLGTLSQLAATSTVTAVSGNGATVGNVVGVQVDEKGVVSAIFDNSQVRKIAQVGIATFQNADGLMAQSGNSYQATLGSGSYTIKQAGIGGAGQVSSSSLEASTVDLSAEFTGLITTQKAYSASSKIITTADQMLEELINIKR
ncbi:MAG: transposase [Alphaproteobacteria bacterium PA2]|nr:MAG: transposase [Alphaproteobacteria bacterium PA2]